VKCCASINKFLYNSIYLEVPAHNNKKTGSFLCLSYRTSEMGEGRGAINNRRQYKLHQNK